MKSGMIRSSLVVFQFMISIFLVVGTVAVYMQLNYIQNKKIGFNKNQVIEVNDAFALGDNRMAYKNILLKNSFIESATISSYLPVSGGWRSDSPWWAEGKDATQENMVSLQNWQADHDYVETLGMTMIQGRDFSRDFPSDSIAVILNESAAQAFFSEEDPLGRNINSYGQASDGSVDKENLQKLTVIGVVEDFHFESLKENISPVLIYLSRRPEGGVLFRFQAGKTKEVIDKLESTWKEMAPGQPFSYSFLDESFGRMYASETRLGTIFGIFAIIAIVIACLGLFALTAFTAEQRTKEIGIRKVLGASVSGIVLMLSKDFGKLVIIAFVLAIPFAWWGINKWLETYQYKVEIGWWVYALSGIAAFLIAWLTMSYQSIRAAISNPVDSLRNE
jgi:putative ABC transport system permease protein